MGMCSLGSSSLDKLDLKQGFVKAAVSIAVRLRECPLRELRVKYKMSTRNGWPSMVANYETTDDAIQQLNLVPRVCLLPAKSGKKRDPGNEVANNFHSFICSFVLSFFLSFIYSFLSHFF